MVKNISDMSNWEHSEAYHEYLGFICSLNDSIKGKSNADGSINVSLEILKIDDLLNTLDSWIDQIPPIKQPQRFGNQAFRQWYSRLKDQTTYLLETLLPTNLHCSIMEIGIYLTEGFGNSTRIDYGTGHELSFLMFLCALFKIGFLKINDSMATASKVFVRYLELVRKLQMTYTMEPAGSHGVWSLDDYQFVPFIWGSSQFVGNIQFEPTCFLKDNIVKKNASQYMFLSCIQYINKVKTGPFAEHSNQLWSISAVSNWMKINAGLIKMYKAEVLAKFPLVQHIYLGSLFSLKPFVPPVKVRPKTSFQALNKSPFDTPCATQSRGVSTPQVKQSEAKSLTNVEFRDIKDVEVKEAKDVEVKEAKDVEVEEAKDVEVKEVKDVEVEEAKDVEIKEQYELSKLSSSDDVKSSEQNSTNIPRDSVTSKQSKQEKKLSVEFAEDVTVVKARSSNAEQQSEENISQ